MACSTRANSQSSQLARNWMPYNLVCAMRAKSRSPIGCRTILYLARELRVYPMRVAGHESVGTPVPLNNLSPAHGVLHEGQQLVTDPLGGWTLKLLSHLTT